MKKRAIKKTLSLAGILFAAFILNCCNSWMQDDGFFDKVDEEVRVASAKEIDVFVRCAATKMGTTTPNGYTVFKQDVVGSVAVVPEPDYGFWKWAAFSSESLDPNKQHTSLICDDPASYEEKFGALELPSSVVVFENPKAEITNVKILEDRKDIFIVPVCVDRPALSVSIPGSGETGVVRNMSIRLLFSKPMDPASFTDEESGAANFTFYQGRATITESSDVSLTDISDYFEEPEFSIENKLVTFNLKSGKLFNANGQITVRFTGDIKDIYGYTVASGGSFQFRVGTAVDSAAPGIDALTFGVEGKYDTFKDIYSKFRSEANVASVKGVSDELCATALSDSAYDNIVTYRTKSNNVNIYVHGIEYKGSSKNKLNASGDESESDIVIIGTRSCLIYDRDGNATGNNIEEEKVVEIDYAAGVTYSPEIGDDSFRESTGTLFAYDISKYPDGLIRIDVALADSVGNFGFENSCTNSENDNGYKSIFIVKDTSAPDAEAIKDVIKSDSVNAVYQWYNAETLASIRFKDINKDDPVSGIIDSGHYRLRSAKKDMKWIFHSGAGDEWVPSAEDEGWKTVLDSYELRNAAKPAEDGNVPVSVAFMDDLGFISSVITVSAITYDNTKPTVDSYLWVDSSNAETLNNTSAASLSQYLKVGVTEILSGIRRIGVKVTKDGASVDGLVGAKLYYSATDAVPSSAGAGIPLTFVENSESGYVFYEIPEALKTGWFFIRGIPIADENGKYDVSVKVVDSALNLSAENDSIAMFKDTTSPVVNLSEDSVDNIIKRPGDDTVWLKRDAYNGNSVSFTVNETGSGIKSIELTGTIGITEATTVTVDGTDAEDVSLDIAANKIIFSNFKTPSIFGANVSVKINEIIFKNKDNESGNTVSFRIEDFASTEPCDISYESKVYADSVAPAVASVTLYDADSTTTWTDGTTNYKYVYTNSNVVNATVVLGNAEQGNSCSGISVLTIYGATITGATVSTGETCTVSENTVTFTPPLTAGAETVELTGVTFAAAESETRSVSAYATDFTEWTGDSVSSQQIVLDVKTPEVTDVSWSVASGSELVPGITGKKVVDDQKLNVTLGATVSGIKTVDVAVTAAGTQRSDSLADGNLKVYFDGTLLSSTDYSVSGNKLTFTTPRKSGVVSFEGLTIDDQERDGSYLIDISLKTAAENENNAASHHSISRDSVTPVISKVVIPPVTVGENQIPVIESVIPYGTDGTGTTPVYFAGAQAGFDYKTGKNSFTLDLYITEKTSGVQQITFESGCNVRLSSESTLSVIHSGSTKDLVKGTDYTVDGTGKVITFLDSGDPVVKDESAEFVLSITKCTFENVKYMDHESASDENRFSFTLKDFAQHSPETSVTTIKAKKDGTEDIATVVANALPAGIESVSLEDRSPCDANGNVVSGKGDGDHDLRKSEEGFTNYEIINVTVSSPTVDVANKNCSVRKITLTGAKFIADTVVHVKGALFASENYRFTDDDRSIEFNKSFDTQTAFQFFNILLATTDDGEKTVYATAYSPAGVSYSAMSTKEKKIILDKTPPALADEGPFAYDYQNREKIRSNEYPRQKNDTDYETYGLKASDLGLETYGSMAGNTGKEIRFFYTSKDDRRLPIKVEDTNSLSSTCLQIKVVDSIKAGEATSQGVLNADGYGHPSYNKANFSTGTLGTAGNVGYYRYESKDWSDNPMPKPYTYVAADRAGNVSAPHQFYVIKDNKSPSITVDGTDYGTATDADRKSKSLTNLMELVIPSGKSVFRNTEENSVTGIYDAKEFDFWNNGDSHNCKDLSTYQYVLSDGEYKIKIHLKSGVSSDTMLIGGVSRSDVPSYSQRLPTPGDSGLAKWAITHYYKKWNSTATESNWDAAWPVGTLGAAFFDSRVTWNDYDGGDIEYTIPDSSIGVPPLTLLLKDNCGNIYQIPIRPTSMDAAMTTHTDGNYPCHSGESVSWIFDKKLPGLVTWESGIEDSMNDQFIIFAGGCDGNEENGKNITDGNTYYAVGCDRFGALYRDTVKNIQYYNHKVYLQLLVKSNEPILWDAQETRTNNVQPLYENGSQPSDFTLRARVLFRDGTGTVEPKESDFAGPSSASLTMWSYFKQKSTDGKRLWNILMPHGDEGKLGTLWLYLEDYVGNKGIYRIKNGDEDKFVWNDEPPKVAIVGADFPTNAKEVSNSDFSTFGSYRYYEHLAFTEYSGEEFAQKMQKLVPPSKYGAHKNNELNVVTTTVKNYGTRFKDPDYTGLYSNLDDLDLYRVYTDESTGTTYYGNHVIKQRSGNEYIENAIKGLASKNDDNNTYTYDSMLSNFNIKVSTVSGITGYKYWTSADVNSYETQSDQAGDNLDGKWFVRSTGGDSDSKRVNTTVPYQFEIENKPLYLYIYDKVGNISITKLGKTWTHDMGHPATSDNTWTSGKANPGESYVKQPENKWIVDATIAGAGEKFAAAKESNSPFEIKIPASWYNDTIAKKRDTDYMASSKGSGIYGAGILPNVIGAATPVDADGNLTIKIPAKVYLEAMDKGTSLMYFSIYDRTGNYWDCHLNVKVDATAPTMRVGVTADDGSTFHTEGELYTVVYKKDSSDVIPSNSPSEESFPTDESYKGDATKKFTVESGYIKNAFSHLYSLSGNKSYRYTSKKAVDDIWDGTDVERKSYLFRIRSNNPVFYVNTWAKDDGGISQVAIKKWDGTKWNSETAIGILEFPRVGEKGYGDSNLEEIHFEERPDSVLSTGKCVDDTDGKKRYAIYVSTAGQSVENLYEVSATDFAGNAVFYYAYILPFDNTGPSASDVSVTGNAGSSVVGDKFYFNELKFSLKASDAGAGLGAYKYGTQGETDFYKYVGDISDMETSSLDFVVSPKFWVKVQDILGNVNTVESFTVNGGDTPISNAKFVYDNVAPSVSFTDLSTNFIRTGNYWNYDYISWGESSDDTGVSTNSFLNYEASSKSLLVTNRDYSSKIEITPTGTDTSGIKGYVMTETSAAPASLSTVAASFVFEAGKDLSTSFEERKISLANTSGLTVYFWAVDYAGNVSTEPAQLTIKFDAKNPDVSPAPSDGKIEVKVDSTKGTRIWSSATHNYYNNAAYIEVILGYKTGYEPKGWKILKSSLSKLRSDQLAYKDFVPTDHEQLEGNLRKYKIYLPALINDRNKGDDFYISFYSNSDSPTYSLVFADKQKWYYDNVVPSAPQIQGLAEGAAGMYYDGAGKLYFKSDASGTLNFTATDNGTVKSGFAGVKYSTTESAPVASVDVSSSVALTGSDLSGKTNLYFYAYDNVWNASSTSYKLTLEEDNTPPEFTVSVDDSSDYVYKKDVATIYYNGTAEHKPESIVFTCSSSDSDLAEFICTASDVTVTQGTGSDSNKFTVSGLGASGSVVLSFKAKDKLGNVTSDADVAQVTLVADSESPSGLAINKIKGIPLDVEAKYIYAESADWKTVSGGTVYCKADQLTDLVHPFEYDVDTLTDALSDLKEGYPSASKDAATDEWTITAMDNVGNESTFTVTLIRDGVAPTTGDGSTQKIRKKNTTVVDRNYKTVGSYSVLEGEFYELKDKANPENGDWITWLYPQGTTITIPVSDTVACSSEYSYSFTYGSYEDKFTTITPDSAVGGDTWSEYVAVSDGKITVDLPEVSTIMHGYLMIWLKDRVGNISCPYNIGSPNNAQQNWIGMYSAPTGVNAQVSGNTLTIENYPASAGIKSVMLVCDKEVSDTPSVTVQLSAVNGSKTEYQVTDARATKGGEGNKTLTLTLPNNFMTVGTVTAWLTLPNETTVTSIKIVDASDHISDEVIATRSISGSFFSKMSTSVSNAIGTLFGRTYEDKNLTSEQRKQMKAEKKAARQAEIAAAKEAKKQAKLLAKQQKEEARLLKARLADSVKNADVAESMTSAATAGTAAAALSTGETIIEANATGIDQWSNAVSGGSALKKGEDRRVPVAPVAAAVALLVLGSGAFVLRRRRQK